MVVGSTRERTVVAFHQYNVEERLRERYRGGLGGASLECGFDGEARLSISRHVAVEWSRGVGRGVGGGRWGGEGGGGKMRVVGGGCLNGEGGSCRSPGQQTSSDPAGGSTRLN